MEKVIMIIIAYLPVLAALVAQTALIDSLWKEVKALMWQVDELERRQMLYVEAFYKAERDGRRK